MNIKIKILNIIFISLILSGSIPELSEIFSQTNKAETRQIININNNWFYLEKGIDKFDSVRQVNNGWQHLNLPHTWNQWDATDYLPGYRRDIGWYKKSLFIPNEQFANYVLYFEGSNISTTLYVNGKLVGKHIGGYVGFEFDITAFIQKGRKNDIYVKVDNSINKEIIPSQKSDFFIYGGITRDVWLKKLPVINITNIKVLTPAVDSLKAKTELKININNSEQEARSLIISARIKDNLNNTVSVNKKNIDIKNGKNFITVRMPDVTRPKLWSPDSPDLYLLEIIIRQNNSIIDSLTEKIGFRWYEFKEHGAFYLNGKRLLLRGTHRHEEWAGYGAAMPNELHRKDMEMIKNLGANFVRLAHYPQDPEIYKACDELGLLVWDELPWCRGGLGNESWKKNTVRLLKEQINQNINHPSVILWSLGNEIYWEPDFDNGDDRDSINSFLNKLNNLAHKLDPTRLTSIRKYYEGHDIVDVFSPSIWAGWYSGVYTNYLQSIVEARKKYKRFFHAEYGGASHVGRHKEISLSVTGKINSKGWEEKNNQIKEKNIARTGSWDENYIVYLFDWHLHISEQLDWFTGNAQWAFKDFGTPLRPENPIPFVNQKGLVDRAGKPKDAYYVFKSYWNKKDKFCYIVSHTWEERRAGKNEKLLVSVYSNCDEVKLVVNGKELKKKKRNMKKFPAMGLNWKVLFNEGQNTLVALGFTKGKKVTSDSINITFSSEPNGKPEKIKLSVSDISNGNKLVTATVVDKKGKRCLDYNKRIYFSINGNGKLLVNYGTPTRSQVIEAANGKAEIELELPKSGKAIVEVRNQDFKGSYITINNTK